MQQNFYESNEYSNEISFLEIIKKIADSQKIILITSLSISLLALLISFLIGPTYTSSALIEIGNKFILGNDKETEIQSLFSDDNLIKSTIIETQDDLIQDLNTNLVFKNLITNFEIDNLKISKIENRLLNIQYLSNSKENSNLIVNQFTSYIVDRHLSILSKANNTVKNHILLKIINWENQLKTINKKITLLEEVILEENRNLLLLKSNPELHINRVSKDTSISSIKFQYQINIVELINQKNEITYNIKMANKTLNINQSFPTLVFNDLSTTKETRHLTFTLFGFILGLLISIVLVLSRDIVTEYKKIQ